MKLLTKTCHEVVFWNHERFIGLRFVDLVNETFSNITFIINLKQFSILSVFSEIFETTRYTYLKSNLHQLFSNRSGCTEFLIFIYMFIVSMEISIITFKQTWIFSKNLFNLNIYLIYRRMVGKTPIENAIGMVQKKLYRATLN